MLSGIILGFAVPGCGDADGTETLPRGASPSAATSAPSPGDTTVPPAPGSMPAAAPDKPGAPVGDLAAAQAFVEPLVLGVNIERGWAWSLPGESTTTSTQYWTYLKSTVHATHVRLFYPWRPSIAMGGGGANNSPPDQAAFDRILDAADQAIKAGLKVFVDFTDVMGSEDFEGDNGVATEAHLKNAAQWSAARKLDPTMIAYGPVNEWAGGDDNTIYATQRPHAHDILRAALPGYVLTTGPAYWKSREFLYDPAKKFVPFADLRVVYEWHHYSSLNAQGWAGEEAKLAAWRSANAGRPTICGEAGPGYWDEPVNGGRLASQPSAWPSRFAEQLPAIAAEHPSIWAVTYGSEYRINKDGDDGHVLDGSGGSPNLLGSLVSSDGAMRKALGK
jgi:hypothetical protein